MILSSLSINFEWKPMYTGCFWLSVQTEMAPSLHKKSQQKLTSANYAGQKLTLRLTLFETSSLTLFRRCKKWLTKVLT